MRVLVVEDERKVADALREGLQAEEYDVAVERTGEGAFFRTATDTFDLILLDLGLPGRDGLEVMAAIRRKHIAVPIIVLTARDTVEQRVQGLDAGADDYLIKPFAFAELFLMRHDGQVVSRETLARDVWKESGRSSSLDNVIDAHMARLRRKVDDEGAVKMIIVPNEDLAA